MSASLTLRGGWFRLVVALAALVVAAQAQAAGDKAVGICIKEARSDAKSCGALAREGQQAATDLCLKRDHQCVEVCRADRASCVDDTGIEGSLCDCASALEDAREVCRGLYLPGTPERNTCIDQAQVVAFECRDTVKEVARPALRICRSTFKACAKACGPVDPLDPPVDPRQCRSDAKVAFEAAKAVCVEDFQIAKDACLNRDHECVEQCRAVRQDCKGPILDALEQAKDACRATRDLEVANCRNLYADGTPERDACIDQAQVVAFICRDDAHEVARPQLQICRQAFRTCVQACPVPPPAP